MSWVLVFFLAVFGLNAWADNGLIQDEINRFELLRHKHKLTPGQTVELAERYFLTSRCSDVRELVKSRPRMDGQVDSRLSNLACVCGAVCSRSASTRELMEFKHLIDKKTDWKNSRLKRLWLRVQDQPEAAYWSFKYLQRQKKYRGLSSELEASLDALEVKNQ